MKNMNCKINYFLGCGLIIAGCGFLLAGCSETNTDRKGDLKQVKVGITSTYQGELATYVAKEREFFEKNGLDVTLKQNPSGKTSLTDLFNGDVQIAHVAETPIVYSLLDTNYYPGPAPPFQIFADMVYSNNVQKIIARRDHGISEPVDIVGKKVALVKGTQIDYFFDSFLLEHQIFLDEFETVNMTPSEQVQAIKNGEIDVAVVWEPYASLIKHELGNDVIFLETDLIYSTLWLATSLDSYAVSNPDILVSYLKSIHEANEYIRKKPIHSQKLLARQTNVPVEIVRPLWTEFDFNLSLSERMLILLEDQARWMIRNNVADTTIQNIEQFINYSPMQEVHPRGITVIQ